MKKVLLALLVFVSAQSLLAQHEEGPVDTTWKGVYRGSAPLINDLVHTKLDANFDYNNSYLIGKVWITLKPHFYPTDSLALDAKGMEIRKVAIVTGASQKDLKYKYDGWVLNVDLDRTYKGGEKY